MLTNSDGLQEAGVFGRAVPIEVQREVFTVAEHRRLEARRRELFFQEVVRCLSWVVCVVLWVVTLMVWRVVLAGP